MGASESVKRRRPGLKLLQEDLPNRTNWSTSRQDSFRLKCLSLSQNVGGGNRNGESGFQVAVGLEKKVFKVLKFQVWVYEAHGKQRKESGERLRRGGASLVLFGFPIPSDSQVLLGKEC